MKRSRVNELVTVAISYGQDLRKSRTRQTGEIISSMKRLYPLLLVSLFPVAFTSFIWLQVVRGVASRAIDGSGHYATGQIYDLSIFPDVFGWTPAYFAGMPFPNFYPPLFFWLVSLLHHTHLLSFGASFKLVVAVPLLLMPAAFWVLAWIHGGRNDQIAFGAAIACATLYTTGEIFQPNTGLDLSSTLLDGFYTQPLGFVLFLLWLLVYLYPRQQPWQFALASVLLALTVLANFFNAITAVLFIGCILGSDIIKLFRAAGVQDRKEFRTTFFIHFTSPWLAFALCAFWVVPMLTTYSYLVTRPVIRPLNELITIPVWCWYFLSAIGGVIWFRKQTGRIGPYLVACLLMIIALITAGKFAPVWFPLQVFRFFSTINFLLCLPVGITVEYAIKLYLGSNKTEEIRNSRKESLGKRVAIVGFTVLVLIALAAVMSTKKLSQAFAFYTSDTFDQISEPLKFARDHRVGRYLVETLLTKETNGLIRADSLALNAYLGAQGNETISIVYREASPNSSFFNAELNAFSAYKENFGISSALVDDLNFINQPLSQHLKRLRFIGVRYLVIAAPDMKERLSREPDISPVDQSSGWTIFELRQPALLKTRTLEYRPALVVGDFSVKLKRQNQYDFMRLAEEQFNDAWFDVLLAHSPEKRIDRLRDLDQFGALVIDTYECDDQAQAFAKLKDFSQTRKLILLSSTAPLFERLKSSISELPHAVIVERKNDELGDWIDAQEPTHYYDNSPVRAVWKEIRANLEQEKQSAAQTGIKADVREKEIQLSVNSGSATEATPVLIAQTFHSNWTRTDGEKLYPATPFFTLTFLQDQANLRFTRDRYDTFALWLSLGTFVVLSVTCVADFVKSSRRFS